MLPLEVDAHENVLVALGNVIKAGSAVPFESIAVYVNERSEQTPPLMVNSGKV